MRDVIPFVFARHGTQYKNYLSPNGLNPSPNADEGSLNCVPVQLNNGIIGLAPRPEFAGPLNVPSSSSDRGRGLIIGKTVPRLYLDESSYYYSGGSQDLKTTTGAGWAGNTGFYSEYLGSWVDHRMSGVSNTVIVNAGHTSTHSSAEHGNVWYVADDVSAPSSVQDADMPGNNGVSITRGGVSLDGYLFLCDINGQIHNSNINDITAWTSTDFITAEREADTGMYLGRHHDNLVYIGTKSIEFFYNAGNASGSPLARRQDTSYSVGCYHPNSILEVGDVIYFVGTDHNGDSGFFKLERFQLTRLSDEKIDEKIQNEQDLILTPTTISGGVEHGIFTSSMSAGQTRGLLLTLSNAYTYYYNFATQLWLRWTFTGGPTYSGGISGWGDIFPIVAGTGINGYQFKNGAIAGIAYADNDSFDDLGEDNQASVFMQPPVWDGGTLKRKRINSVRVLFDGRASDSGFNDPVTATLRWFDFSDTNSSTSPEPPGDYNTGRDINLNVARPMLTRLGSARKRQWLLDWPAAVGPVAIGIGLEIDYDIVE